MVDTHAHLNAPQFNADRHEVIARAFDAGVEAIVDVGTDLASSRESVALAEQYDRIFAAVGCHPHDAQTMDDTAWGQLRALADHKKVVAIGETGLDFYRDLSPRPVQMTVFRAHIRLAKEMELPLIVHDRQAHEEVMDILRDENADGLGGVLHCFPGDLDMAREAMAMNFYLGFGGPITFKKSRALSVAQGVPADRILLETDCPYLAPVPRRGKRNEPALLSYVLDKLAEGHRKTREEIERLTTENACRVFRIGNIQPQGH